MSYYGDQYAQQGVSGHSSGTHHSVPRALRQDLAHNSSSTNNRICRGRGRGRGGGGRVPGRGGSAQQFSYASHTVEEQPDAGQQGSQERPSASHGSRRQIKRSKPSSNQHQPRPQHARQLQQHSQQHPQRQQHEQQRVAPTAPNNITALSGEMFASLGLHPLTLSGLHDVFGYEEMFVVQAAACPPALQGHDVLVKAKTGTGKTLAFLIPLAEHLAAGPPLPAGPISSLVLAPTRELASQIKAEAVKLLQPYGGRLGVQMVIGGTNINRERSGISNGRCDVLIATPGRLQDHIDTTDGFAGKLWGVQVLVLDEVDRLLDMGFRPAIQAIMKHLPPAGQRQTLMFSATLPKGVTEAASELMRSGFKSINTVPEDERPSHEAITQEYMLVPAQQVMHQLMAVVKAHMQQEPEGFKIIAFFPTARAAQFHAALARAAGCNCLELHSRLSQKQRDTAAATFGSSQTAVIFASDVIARGLDFPDVSLVVQVSLTDATQYEHRVGRTGRAGKTGEALLLLADDESRLLPHLSGFPLKLVSPTSRTSAGRVMAAGGLQSNTAWEGLSGAVGQVSRDDGLLKSAEQAFIATLGFLQGKLKQLGWSKEQLVANVKLRFIALGLPRAPAIEARTLGKMNLKGVPGIEVAPPRQRTQNQGNRSAR